MVRVFCIESLGAKGAEAHKGIEVHVRARQALPMKQTEYRTPVAEVCRKARVSLARLFNWKKKCAGLMPSEMKRARELEQEDTRLKKIVADRLIP